MSWIKVLLGLIAFSAFLSYIFIPWAAQVFTRFRLRATKLSPFSALGLEWRSKSQAAASVPTLRVERIFWSWGGSTAHSRVTLNVEGVTFRVHKKTLDGSHSAPKKKMGLPPAVKRSLSRFFHLILSNWSKVARLLSIRVADVRVILEDMGGAETTIEEICFGLDRVAPCPPPAPPLNPDEKPLVGSPAHSPSVDSMGDFFRGRRQDSGRSSFHRRASSIHNTIQSTFTKTASHLWSHATGSAVERITFSTSIHNIALLSPKSQTSVPNSSSFPNLSSKTASGGTHRPTGLTTLGPINSLLKLRPSTTTFKEERLEKLLVIEGHSSITVCVGFGPNRSVLDRDNLRTILDIGTVHASLEGVEKIQALSKLRPKKTKPASDSATPVWAREGTPRVLLRAFEFATVSLARVHISHLLPVTYPKSAASSSTDVSETASANGKHNTLSLDFIGFSLQVTGCNSTNNSQLSKIFGRSTNPSSVVDGIAAKLEWQSIELQCIAPGESGNDKSQLVAVRQAEFDVITTWLPEGWERKDLLFADDPNLALLLARGCIASIDVATDLQLCSELSQSWTRDHPPRSPNTLVPKPYLPILPRVRLLLDIGPMSVVVANQADEHSATLTLATDGVSFGAHSHYSDISAPIKSEDKTKPSEKLEGGMGMKFNPSPLTYSTSLQGNAFISVDPISLRMSLGSRNEKTYRLASVGRIEGKATVGIFGGVSHSEEGKDTHFLVKKSLIIDTEVFCESGVRVEIWHSDVIEALVQLAGMKEPKPPKPANNPLDRMPSGITLRVSLGLISVFVAHEDPNPHCDLRLVHGLWLQTKVVLNYARYAHTGTKSRCGHLLRKDLRDHFSLFDDLTSKAYEYASHTEQHGGAVALFSVLVTDTYIRPVFNGPRFVSKGGTGNVMPDEDWTMPPRPDVDLEFAAWGWSGSKRREQPNNQSTEGKAPSDTDGRPFVRIPYTYFTGTIRRQTASAPVEIGIQSRIERVQVDGHLSDIYCSLLAVQTLRVIANAFKKSPVAASLPIVHKDKPSIAFHLIIPSIWVHFTFPLGEAVFFFASRVSVDKNIGKSLQTAAEHVLLHVQSPTHQGLWDELGRIKKLKVAVEQQEIVVGAKAFRIRIPYAFLLSQLILNINLTLKATKLLVSNLKSGVFHLVKVPGSEAPKKVPNLRFEIELLHLEARDHPVENKINLNNRVGIIEQNDRIHLEDLFEQKLHLLSDPDQRPGNNHLTTNFTIDPAEARWRLDWHISRNWVKRIKKAREYERRREEQMQNRFKISQDTKLPIHILPLEQTTPLFRAAMTHVNLSISQPKLSRSEIIEYMGDMSVPFREDTEFSLMVPFNLDWSMGETKALLRDYPLPLLRIDRATNGPSWRVRTLFVIAEELPRSNVEDSCLFFPVQVLPAQSGHPDAKPLWVQVAKTINPVKSYASPNINVYTCEPTRLTWCNSYSPGLTDVARVIDRLSSPPRDPSPKPGFWDKMGLVLHWKVTMAFESTFQVYLKGSTSPYAVTGYGSGFSLILRHNVRVEIAQPNPEKELIQFKAEELIVTIPDLGFLHDAAAVGVKVDTPSNADAADRAVIERRSRKPCARFTNGIRFGLGFRFERTCRAWSCEKGCGETENLLHRQCRIFDFKPHNEITLRSPEAIERAEAEAGHTIDSYEGFRSDFIHFSVSLAAPRDPDLNVPKGSSAETHNSLHLSPKAFAHFFNWWALFSNKIPAPIRTGKAFPDTPPPSKKFSKSIATIKYGCDLRPVFVSHMYSQVTEELWSEGRAQYLGVKLATRRMRIDAHQRMQEKRDWNEQLNRVKVITHKPFYAVDVLLHDIQIVGIVADFDETRMAPAREKKAKQAPTTVRNLPKASELPKELRMWFNYFDFIDADRKPFDRDPRMEIVSLGDCPYVSLGRRTKARKTMPDLEEETDLGDMEASKFGHEHTHVCCLGADKGIGPVQQQVAQQRIDELADMLVRTADSGDEAARKRHAEFIQHRVLTLNHYIDDIGRIEKRHIDNNTLESTDSKTACPMDEPTQEFQNTLHVHNPRLYFNNGSRNILFKYLYSRNNRQKEEYTSSYASIRGIRDGVKRRHERELNGLNRDDLSEDLQGEESGRALLEQLERVIANSTSAESVKINDEFYSDDVHQIQPKVGLPTDCSIVPHWRANVIKPQISFRSNLDEDAVILVAVDEISFQGFAVKDATGLDPIATDVLSRNYVGLKGLQAFYPTKEVSQQNCVPDIRTGQLNPDFLPLEVFLDVRSETTEYDRIVLKTDISLAIDRFNSLRVPRGLEWPEVYDEVGEPIEHLRKHQNSTTIIVPMLTVSARPNHYAALYYIVTDFMRYRDPEIDKRNEKITNFMYKFDQRDRDPQQLLSTLFVMQQHIRGMTELQRGYELNVDRLTDEGKRELFRIRTDLLHESDALFTVFEVINLNRAIDDARNNARTLSRIDIRMGNLAWHMLRDNGEPLLKFNIKQVLSAIENNQDGSTDSAIVFGDLQALNSNATAVFPEVLSRWEKPKKKKPPPFLSGMLCLSERVGGIDIVRSFCIFLQPIRIRLEQEVGSSLVDYVFTDKAKKRDNSTSSKTPAKDVKGENGRDKDKDKDKDKDSIISGKEGHHSSLFNHNSHAHANGPKRASTLLSADNNMNLDSVPDHDAEEMRQRAKANRTFVSIVVGSTSFVLDYKRDDRRKQHGLVWPECVDFRLVAPKFEYHNEILTFKELFDKVKADIRSSAWSQKGDIVSQVIKKTSVFRSKKTLRQIAGISTDLPSWSRRSSPKSPLRFTAVPNEADEMGQLPRSQTASQTESNSSGLSPSTSRKSADKRSQSPSTQRRASNLSTHAATPEPDDDHSPRRGLRDRFKHRVHDMMEVLEDHHYLDDGHNGHAETPARTISSSSSLLQLPRTSSQSDSSTSGASARARGSSAPPQ